MQRRWFPSITILFSNLHTTKTRHILNHYSELLQSQPGIKSSSRCGIFTRTDWHGISYMVGSHSSGRHIFSILRKRRKERIFIYWKRTTEYMWKSLFSGCQYLPYRNIFWRCRLSGNSHRISRLFLILMLMEPYELKAHGVGGFVKKLDLESWDKLWRSRLCDTGQISAV